VAGGPTWLPPVQPINALAPNDFHSEKTNFNTTTSSRCGPKDTYLKQSFLLPLFYISAVPSTLRSQKSDSSRDPKFQRQRQVKDVVKVQIRIGHLRPDSDLRNSTQYPSSPSNEPCRWQVFIYDSSSAF
jgi:hypothetical protein